MATIEQLSSALIKADAAGDTEAARAFAGEISAKRKRLADQIESDRKLYDPTVDMSGLQKFTAGVGKGLTDVGRGVGQLFGAVSKEDIDEAKRLDSPLMKSGAGISGNVAGNVLAALPTAFIPGVNTVSGGALVGSVLGGLQPVGADESRLKNILVGGAAGLAFPAVVGSAKAAKAALYDPLFSQKKVMGGALTRAAGDKASEVVNALRGPGAATEGVKLSSGAVSRNEGLSALEDAIKSQLPGGELARIDQANRNVLADALRTIAGTPEDMAKAKSIRQMSADTMYGAARLKGIDPAALDPGAQQNIANFMRRIPEDILGRAREIAKINGTNMDNESAIQGMHWVKKAIDSKIGTAMRSGDNEMARAYTSLQNDLLDGLSKISPEYDAARRTFKNLSVPINQMQVGQSLANKLIPATADDMPASLNYAQLARAMRDPDAVARLSTGFEGAKMGSILSPDQMISVKNATADASRIAEALRRGTGSGSPTARRLAQGDMLSQHFASEAPVTSRILRLAGAKSGSNIVTNGVSAIGSMAGPKINSNMLNKLDDMLANNPQQVAQLIEKELMRIPAGERQKIIQALPQAVVLGLSSNATQ